MVRGLILLLTSWLLFYSTASTEIEGSREEQVVADNAPFIPMETNVPPKFESYSLLEARDTNGERALIQQVPALFSSSGEEMERCFVALVERDHSLRNLRPADTLEERDRFFFDQTDDGLLNIREEGNLVLTYRFGRQEPKGVPSDRFRSTYIHPVVDPYGSVLTDDFPEDHLHHRGLSWMWPNVVIDGQVLDLWHLRGIYQRFESWILRESGPICGTIGVKNTWNTAERTVADEWVWVRTFAAGRLGRVVDITLTWKARERISIRGAETKGYGGLCFRLGPRLETVITTPQGPLDADSDLRSFAWADQSGRFGGSTSFSGVAVFQHPKNLSFPAGWCLRHYGFLGVSWPGTGQFILEPNLPLTLRFRFWIHKGDASEGRVREAYQGFADLAARPMLEIR